MARGHRPATAESVARHLLALAAQDEEPTPVTHLQLQKLLYYTQGWSLAILGRPLFEGTIEAWRHGPVVRELFPRFADYGSSPIPPHEGREASLSADDRRLIEHVWRGYGRYSPSHLRNLTHGEAPWRDARAGTSDDAPSQDPIQHESLRRFFRALHESGARRLGLDPARLEEGRRDALDGRTVPFDQLAAEARRGVAA